MLATITDFLGNKNPTSWFFDRKFYIEIKWNALMNKPLSCYNLFIVSRQQSEFILSVFVFREVTWLALACSSRETLFVLWPWMCSVLCTSKIQEIKSPLLKIPVWQTLNPYQVEISPATTKRVNLHMYWVRIWRALFTFP